MGFKVATLWQAPEINPVNGKARSIPILNPINKYGRVFVSNPVAIEFMIVWARSYPALFTCTASWDNY